MPTDYFTQLSQHQWLSESEGQLSIDVIETPDHIVIRSAIAGVSAENLDISVTQDTVTVRGTRSHGCEESKNETVHVRECYWGSFSRSVVLPCHVVPDSADATLKNGILTVTLRKTEIRSRVSVIDLGE